MITQQQLDALTTANEIVNHQQQQQQQNTDADDDDDDDDVGSNNNNMRPTFVVPKGNEAIDADLNQNNVITTSKQKVIYDFLMALSDRKESAILQFTSLKQPLLVDGTPSRRTAGYYIRVLSTPEHDEPNFVVYNETVRIARALLHCGLPYSDIQNAAVLDRLRDVQYSKYNLNTWKRSRRRHE